MCCEMERKKGILVCEGGLGTLKRDLRGACEIKENNERFLCPAGSGSSSGRWRPDCTM